MPSIMNRRAVDLLIVQESSETNQTILVIAQDQCDAHIVYLIRMRNADLDRANIRLAFKSLPISLENRNHKLLCIINGRIEVEGNGDFLADLCGTGENLGNAVCRPNADWLHEQVDSAPIVCRHAELPVS